MAYGLKGKGDGSASFPFRPQPSSHIIQLLAHFACILRIGELPKVYLSLDGSGMFDEGTFEFSNYSGKDEKVQQLIAVHYGELDKVGGYVILDILDRKFKLKKIS